ncbi:DUF1707 SHOCT-like domain-containing protein [Corynebacterium freiburgense]|uniref:DUF1707 SHOCT-like domain-containing protein n=1 Tax=Corynebacterium freiburgense TaxID=556548 RepID=UPI00041AF48C|nr:DUF1707 domain-containing protein [Corynebacterium freiburgense]WJZ02694.1 hypothetical protein CFREI_07045 [Corynebacterium freiburgense]
MGDPDIRLSDKERDDAFEALRQHLSDGRLTLQEFDERAAAVVKATTRGDLYPLFRDLPATLAEHSPSPLPNSFTGGSSIAEIERRKKYFEKMMVGVWATTLVIFFVSLFILRIPWFWVVFPIAGVLHWALDEFMGISEEEEKLLEQSKRKELNT